MCGDSAGNAVHIINDCRVVQLLGHQSRHLHFTNSVLTGLDVLRLIFLDFTKPDVLDIAPMPVPICPIFELPRDFLKLPRPLFDQVQFQTVNTAATFNPNTGGQTNTTFGKITAARNERRMVMSIRYIF